MKTKTYTSVILFLLILITSNIFGQSNDIEKQILKGKEILYNAFLKYDEASYMQAYSLFERVGSAEPGNELTLYYLTYAQYRLIAVAMNKKNDELFDKFYDHALENCETLFNSEKLRNEAKVLKAAIHMMKLAGSPLQGPFLAPKINSLLEEVMSSDSTNPRTLLIKGMMDYNTPAFFGGSVENAINRYNKAITIFESLKKEEGKLEPDWGYIETLAWLGQAYASKGEVKKAKEIYEKAITIEPNFGWVRGYLIPALSNKEN